MKKDKIGLILAIIVTLAVVSFGVVLAVKSFNEERTVAKKEEKVEALQGIIATQVDKVKGLSTLVVVEDHYIPYEIVGSDYIMLNQYKRFLGEDGQKFYQDIEVALYDVATLTLKDVFKAAELVEENLTEDYGFTSLPTTYYDRKKISISLETLKSKESLVAKFPLDFKEVSIGPEKEEKVMPIETSFFPFFDSEFLEAQDLDYDFIVMEYGDAGINIMLTGRHLPDNNEKLYKMFPLFKEYEDDYEQRYDLFLREEFDTEELLALFKEEDEPVFKPYKMSEYTSTDGKEHEIKSLSDFEKWAIVYKDMANLEEELEE